MSEYLRIAGEDIRIRKYGVVGSGWKTVVRIEIEVTDPGELGWMLKTIGEAQQAASKSRAEKAAAARAEKKLQKSLTSRQPFLLGYDRGRS
jgi:hypothetical protein